MRVCVSVWQWEVSKGRERGVIERMRWRGVLPRGFVDGCHRAVTVGAGGEVGKIGDEVVGRGSGGV